MSARVTSARRRAPKKIPHADRPVPVTLLSGFLGSGKTSLMKHILQNKEGLRVAVIMNEISEVNIDVMALEGSKLLQTKEKVVEMANGCICCTLREDLLLQLRELARSGNFDAVLIESSGIAEPMQVAETFFVDTADGNARLQVEAPLDNCVTVIDASMMRRYMESLEGVEAIDPNADTSGESGAAEISGLLFSQLEFANVVLLNKVDLLPGGARSSAVNAEEHQKNVDELTALVKRINPYAKVVPTEHSKVPLSEVLCTKNFSYEFAEKINNWMEDIKSGIKHVPETLEYGVSSFYFTSDRPFHPQRLHDWFDKYFLLKQLVIEDVLNPKENENATWEEEQDEEKAPASEPQGEAAPAEDGVPEVVVEEGEDIEETKRRHERYGNLFRSKGFVWVGGYERGKHMASWSQAGPILTFEPAGWVNDAERPGQKLVFIGQNLNHAALKEDMEALLLTDEEWDALRKDVVAKVDGTFPDPFRPFPRMEDILAANIAAAAERAAQLQEEQKKIDAIASPGKIPSDAAIPDDGKRGTGK